MDDEAAAAAAIAKKMNNTLNVNAPVFVPGFTVPTPSDETAAATTPPSATTATPLESWEDHSTEESTSQSSATAVTTPEGTAEANEDPEDDEEDEDEEEVSSSSCEAAPGEEATSNSGVPPPSKPRTKAKPRLKSETTTDKEHVNVVFIGHVDAGKSTIGGQMMYLTGMVDKRTLEKYEREAKEKNRETWYLSWCMDTNLEEREKGKTVEVGRAYFETETKHFTILDAPGHKSFVPNMIGGASQADLAVLVISARKGEFETGFERGGQTREHAMLVKTVGVKHLVVLINKMDDPTVKWSEERYNYCKDNLTPYLKKVGFNPSKDIMFMPCSGLTGIGLKEDVASIAPWFTGVSFITYLDSLPPLDRNVNGPFMMPIVDKYSDMGTVIIGKVESGECKKGQSLSIYPNRTDVRIDQLWSDDIEVTHVSSGENVKVKLKGVEEADITPGYVLCDPNNPIKSCKTFDAQVVILEHKSIICAGKSFVLHLQAIIEEVNLKALICLVDKKTGEKYKTRPRFIKQDQIAIVRFEASEMICMERFKDYPQLGRFTLRDEGKTIAIGKILKLVDPS